MADVVQRWRVVYRRGQEAAGLAQRDELEAWESALEATGLPVATTSGARPRPRMAMPPPLPVGLIGERELLDLLLVERCTAAETRERLARVSPVDHAVVDLFDVWVGAPPLPAVVVAMDYAVTLDGPQDPEAIGPAVSRILAAPRIERVRSKGGREVTYDLRPFILGLRLETGADRLAETDARAGCVLEMRLGVHPEQGTRRPDEVVAALADELGRPLAIGSGARTRIWTIDEAISSMRPS